MLVVRERRTLVVASLPSLHREQGVGPAGEELEDVEGVEVWGEMRKSCEWRCPRTPMVRLL